MGVCFPLLPQLSFLPDNGLLLLSLPDSFFFFLTDSSVTLGSYLRFTLLKDILA